VDVTGLSGLDDSLSSLPYRHQHAKGQTPTQPMVHSAHNESVQKTMPVIAGPAQAAQTSRTNLPSTVRRNSSKYDFSFIAFVGG